MSFYVLFLVLTAAVLHAFWNVLSKKAGGKAPFLWLMYIASTIIYLPVLICQVLKSQIIFSEALLWFSLSSAVLHITYFLILQKGYRKGDLSVVYPLARGSGPLFSSAAAILFLQEELKLFTTLGLVFILSGVLVVTGLRLKATTNLTKLTGVFWGILTGLFIAFYTFNDAVAIKSYAVSPLMITFLSNFLGCFLLFPLVIGQKVEIKREVREHKWPIMVIGFLSPAAYILVLEAMKYAPLTVVAPARETSILLGVFMGSRVLSEQNGKRRLIGSVLILAGIVTLSIA